jgi:hypothetical protein
VYFLERSDLARDPRHDSVERAEDLARYAPITGMRGDQVLPQLLGIGKFRGEDCLRRAFGKQNEEALTLWMDRQMNKTYAALLDQ